MPSLPTATPTTTTTTTPATTTTTTLEIKVTIRVVQPNLASLNGALVEIEIYNTHNIFMHIKLQEFEIAGL